METQFQQSGGVVQDFREVRSDGGAYKAPVVAPVVVEFDTTREAIAVQIVGRMTEGRIFPPDRKFIATALRDAYQRSEHRQLQQEINEVLGTTKSFYRVLLDDNLAEGETRTGGLVTPGLIILYVVDKITGAITSGMSAVTG